MTRPVGSREALLEALYNIILNASEEDKSKLSNSLEEYAYKTMRSYRDMTKGRTLIASILDVLEESSDTLISRDSSGMPSREE